MLGDRATKLYKGAKISRDFIAKNGFLPCKSSRNAVKSLEKIGYPTLPSLLREGVNNP
jgi:hypothetical protein